LSSNPRLSRSRPEPLRYDPTDTSLLAHLFGPGRAKEGVLTLEDLYREVALVANLSLEEAKRTVDAIFLTITTHLQRWEKVRLTGIGGFRPYIQPPRRYGNPRRGGTVTTPACFAPIFEIDARMFRTLNPHIKDTNYARRVFANHSRSS